MKKLILLASFLFIGVGGSAQGVCYGYNCGNGDGLLNNDIPDIYDVYEDFAMIEYFNSRRSFQSLFGQITLDEKTECYKSVYGRGQKAKKRLFWSSWACAGGRRPCNCGSTKHLFGTYRRSAQKVFDTSPYSEM